MFFAIHTLASSMSTSPICWSRTSGAGCHFGYFMTYPNSLMCHNPVSMPRFQERNAFSMFLLARTTTCISCCAAKLASLKDTGMLIQNILKKGAPGSWKRGWFDGLGKWEYLLGFLRIWELGSTNDSIPRPTPSRDDNLADDDIANNDDICEVPDPDDLCEVMNQRKRERDPAHENKSYNTLKRRVSKIELFN